MIFTSFRLFTISHTSCFKFISVSSDNVRLYFGVSIAVAISFFTMSTVHVLSYRYSIGFTYPSEQSFNTGCTTITRLTSFFSIFVTILISIAWNMEYRGRRICFFNLFTAPIKRCTSILCWFLFSSFGFFFFFFFCCVFWFTAGFVTGFVGFLCNSDFKSCSVFFGLFFAIFFSSLQYAGFLYIPNMPKTYMFCILIAKIFYLEVKI